MANGSNTTKRAFTIEDLQRSCKLSGACLSRDGKLLAYVITKAISAENTDKDFIVIIDLATKQQVDSWEGSAPLWSPVENELAFIADHNGTSFIWIYSLQQALKKPLVPIYESHYFMGHLALANFAWSPNAHYIAFVSADTSTLPGTSDAIIVTDRLLYKTKGGRGRPLVAGDSLSQIWIASLNGGEPRLITAGKYNEHSLSWSPDSSKIAFVSNRTEDPDNNQFHDLWSVDILTGEICRHTDYFGTVYQPAWSPDGKCIAFLGTLNTVSTNDSLAEDTKLFILDCTDSSVTCLTHSAAHNFDRRIEQFCWHPGTDSIYFTAGSEGTTAIYKVAIDTGQVAHVEGKRCHILEFSISKAGDVISFVRTDTTHPAEVFLLDLTTNGSQQVTDISEDYLQDCQLQEAADFWFKSFDGLDVQGWLIKPAGFDAARLFPLVLVIHGGPHNMFGYELEERMQLLAAKGYGVLFINPRGSSGYGQAFSYGNISSWGGGDYGDLMAGLDEAIKNNSWIDPDRLGVTGQSYGGYMTNWIITQTKRFKAAVVDGGISNLVSFAGTSLYSSLIESEFNGSAYDNFSLLWQCSPLSNVKHVTTPTLILHGQFDNEVPLSQAEEMYTALRKQGVDTMMVQYVGEGHGWRPDLKPNNRLDLLQRTISWFDKYLMNEQPEQMAHAGSDVPRKG